jgi:GNAT superfamily N-acetyltransferase
MLHELKPSEYHRVRSLFQGFDYSLSIHALIEGNNPGRIFVDSAERPRAALALTVEGTLLAGDHGNPDTNAALRRLLREQIFTGKVFVEDDWSVTLAVHPHTWEAKLPELIPTHEADRLPRFHYLCRELKLNWHHHLPEGYAVRRIDHGLLTDPVLTIPEDIPGKIKTYWGTADHFVSKGAGFCVVHENEAVSWCIADCTAGDQMDLGIMTAPAHRRRGLATVATAATVEYCLSRGFAAAGWHCEQDNVGSWKTAEKVGFERMTEYLYYYYIFDEADHLAQLGWSCLKRGEYEKTVRYYERVFALRDDHPDYYYHGVAEAWGALANRDMALRYLNLAVDKGWAALDYTSQAERFRSLHGTPEWEAVLARMQRNVE